MLIKIKEIYIFQFHNINFGYPCSEFYFVKNLKITFVRWINWLFLLLALFAVSCKNQRKEASIQGGTFRMAIEENILSFQPAQVTDYHTSTVLSQIMEGLVSLDQETLEPVPQLAERFRKSDDNMEFTFVLRKEVLFHPHADFEQEDDRILTTKDVVYSFEKACSGKEESPAFTSVLKNQLVGAKSFFDKKSDSIKGIICKNDSIILRLTAPDPNFLYKLAHINFAIQSHHLKRLQKQEAIGTGPFRLTKLDSKKITLDRNESYYLTDDNGCALPYLNRLEFTIERDKKKQLELFQAKQLDFITSLPSDELTQVLENSMDAFNQVPPTLILRNNPLLATNFYFFDMTDHRFQDVRVRKAFNYAIDKEKIDLKILKGQYNQLGEYGITPPIYSLFQGYEFGNLQQTAFTFDPNKARELLKSAGYKSGVDFGKVVLRINAGDLNSAIAEEVALQIESTLGISVIIDGSDYKQYVHDADRRKGDLFRMTWFADYKSPETFLNQFYGGFVPKDTLMPSPINQSRYRNSLFDSYMDAAKMESKKNRQLANYYLAELELIKNPPFIVLWYSGENQLIYAQVRNLKDNPMSYLSFREVYFKPWTREEYLKQFNK